MLFNDNNLQDELDELAKPLMEFLAKHTNPHCKLIVDSGSAELVQGLYCCKKDTK